MVKRASLRVMKWAKENPERVKEINSKYVKTHLGKLRVKCKNYRLKNPILYKKYEKTKRLKHPEIEKKHKAKRRKLGFIPLNKPFSNSEAHHIDKELVVYIPEEIHKLISHNVWTGKGMDKINDKALEWLIEHDNCTTNFISDETKILSD